MSSDDAATRDELNRKGFAKDYCDILRALAAERPWEKPGQPSIVTHLRAPWGAGKTTLLNFIEEELDPDPGQKRKHTKGEAYWRIVRFNAWEHQAADPPWYAILNSVQAKILSSSNRWNRLRFCFERSWQLRLSLLLILPFFLGVLAYILFGHSLGAWLDSCFGAGSGARAGLAAKAISALFLALAAVWKGVPSLVPGNSKEARALESIAEDPTGVVRRYFGRLLDASVPKDSKGRILVVLDDLDRCKPQFVVQLLEATQNLFNDSRVFYIIAADARWIARCFELEYERLADKVTRPGKELGDYFLEKLFQLTLVVPAMTSETKEAYFRREILKAPERVTSGKANAEPARSGPDREQRSATVEEEAARHRLERFASLLPGNPRVMKLFANNFSLAIKWAKVSGLDVQSKADQLALFILLDREYPSLTAELMERPESLDEMIAAAAPEGNPSPSDSGALDLAMRRTARRARHLLVGVELEPGRVVVLTQEFVNELSALVRS